MEDGKKIVRPDFRTIVEVGPRLDNSENFPGWTRASSLLKREILDRSLADVADIGGGANPLIDTEFIRAHRVNYSVLDISQEELDKGPPEYNKIQVNVGAKPDKFCARVGANRFDLVFSHMFLEHVSDAECVHRNIHAALKPGGLSIHFYPSPGNLPLTLNRYLPENLTRLMVRIAQPDRDMDGHQVKFPVFYSMCGRPSDVLHARFRKLGFEVLRHTGYIGHWYYDRLAVGRALERAMRSVLLNARIPLIAHCLLILRKVQLPPSQQ